MHRWCEFGENVSNTQQDIVLTMFQDTHTDAHSDTDTWTNRTKTLCHNSLLEYAESNWWMADRLLHLYSAGTTCNNQSETSVTAYDIRKFQTKIRSTEVLSLISAQGISIYNGPLPIITARCYVITPCPQAMNQGWYTSIVWKQKEMSHALAIFSIHRPNDTKMSNIGGVSKNVFGSVCSEMTIATMTTMTE